MGRRPFRSRIEDDPQRGAGGWHWLSWRRWFTSPYEHAEHRPDLAQRRPDAAADAAAELQSRSSTGGYAPGFTHNWMEIAWKRGRDGHSHKDTAPVDPDAGALSGKLPTVNAMHGREMDPDYMRCNRQALKSMTPANANESEDRQQYYRLDSLPRTLICGFWGIALLVLQGFVPGWDEAAGGPLGDMQGYVRAGIMFVAAGLLIAAWPQQLARSPRDAAEQAALDESRARIHRLRR